MDNKSKKKLPRIRIQGRHLIDPSNRVILLRGVSISGNSKLPSKPDGQTHFSKPIELFNHTDLSFINHPLDLKDAYHHFSQLSDWGYDLIRLVVCWESIEHDGPGIYDTAYINYLVDLIKICENLGLYVIIDAHQDVWSRLCGGSGAPGWTLEIVGFEPAHLVPTGAATLQQLGAPKGVWPSGYQKLAAATMFTLFFAGETFAPKRKVKRNQHAIWSKESNSSEEISIERFLQDSMIEAFGRLADRLAEFDCVIGFEPMNEPHYGYIQLYSPYAWNPRTDLFLHDCPTFIESLALGDGRAQSIDVYTPIWPIPSFRFHRRKISPPVRAWKDGIECIWKEHGIWTWDEERSKAKVLKPNYFNFDPATGKPFEFYQQALYPFVRRFASRVQRLKPDALILVGPIPNEFYRTWETDKRPPNLVAAPHFYDLFSLIHKSHGNMTLDVQAICMKKPIWKWIYFGHEATKKKLWNYNPYNTDEHGDGWNGENFSFISSSAPKNSNGHHEPRILDAILRPYVKKIAGVPVATKFDMKSMSFEFKFETRKSLQLKTNQTEFFIPKSRYSTQLTKIEISDGKLDWDFQDQSLIWTHDQYDDDQEGQLHSIKINLKTNDHLSTAIAYQNQKSRMIGTVVSVTIGLLAMWLLVLKE
ncbi:hypothetical protein CROQUDRAFT_90961 [Cronartium quercuum f. sp. fusiforme G11]|uniref:Uncharacterized protein n=1 Tax=Cronartium quercuum f. sp. fusiforme G11 TaxID=708437 RepID=A0A9P6NPH3_9BASI|nr:hypothetical protein CROQUDRAFT_90961 [Cronartium quercuum f. sp. fusiforme G11]